MEAFGGEGDRLFMRRLRAVGSQFLPCERSVFVKQRAGRLKTDRLVVSYYYILLNLASNSSDIRQDYVFCIV